MEVVDQIKAPSWFWICSKIAGGALFAAACLFVVRQFFVYWGDLNDHAIPAETWIVCFFVSIIYASLNLLLAFGWLKILDGLGATVKSTSGIRIYAISQLAKYVPGNIFQFAGRHVLAEGSGVSHTTLAKSTLIELATLVAGGVMCLPLILPYLVPSLPWWMKLAVFILPILLLLYLATRHFGQNFLNAITCYLLFLLGTGVCFAFIFIIIADVVADPSSVAFFTGAFVVAWLVGLVTPGAPAGLGVREAILTLLLASFAPTPQILLAVLMSRMTTLGGDVLFFISGFFVNRKKPRHSLETANNTKACNE
jgi:hypothetical protein